MSEQQDVVAYNPGDKVRVRVEPYRGARGIIEGVNNSALRIRLTTDQVLDLDVSEITNYSLAARRAWESMPKRAGRPPSPGRHKKMVSLRIDADVWERLGQAVELGIILSREQIVNQCLKQKVDELLLPDVPEPT